LRRGGRPDKHTLTSLTAMQGFNSTIINNEKAGMTESAILKPGLRC